MSASVCKKEFGPESPIWTLGFLQHRASQGFVLFFFILFAACHGSEVASFYWISGFGADVLVQYPEGLSVIYVSCKQCKIVPKSEEKRKREGKPD